MLLVQLQKNKSLRSQLAVTKRKLTRFQEQTSTAVAKKQKKTDLSAYSGSLVLHTRGKTGKRLTEQSAFALGVRRNLSQIACSTLGSTILMDLSGQRVARAEIKTGAAVVASMQGTIGNVMRACYDIAADRVADAPDIAAETLADVGSDWTLCIIAYRSDATNSSVWRRESLHVLDADFLFVSDRAAVAAFDADRSFSISHCLRHGCSGQVIQLCDFIALSFFCCPFLRGTGAVWVCEVTKAGVPSHRARVSQVPASGD